MIIKVNQAQGKVVVAICDDELLGKVIEQQGAVLDLSSDFYKGDAHTEQQVRELMRKAENLNLVGKKTIALALEEKIIEKENIRTIKNVPYAQVAIIQE